MDEILLGIGEVIGLCLIAVFLFMTAILTNDTLGPRFHIGGLAADAIKYACFCLAIPLFAVLFLVAPHGWQPSDYRNSAGFRVAMLLGSAIVDVPVLAVTLRAVHKWHKG
jgi:hypothetical protein